MARTNVKTFIGENDKIVCTKCKLDLSILKEDPYIAHDDFNDDNGFMTCKGEEYIICPNCGHEITLSTWIEEF